VKSHLTPIQFGTKSNPTPAQAALINEIQARISSFIRTSNPNSSGNGGWLQSGATDVKAKVLGGSGVAAVGGCSVGFFGNEVCTS
jgi:hypothetical protein